MGRAGRLLIVSDMVRFPIRAQSLSRKPAAPTRRAAGNRWFSNAAVARVADSWPPTLPDDDAFRELLALNGRPLTLQHNDRECSTPGISRAGLNRSTTEVTEGAAGFRLHEKRAGGGTTSRPTQRAAAALEEYVAAAELKAFAEGGAVPERVDPAGRAG